jgi:hypothetical protein|tara:strand:+ start:501 stop:887 length:387 start_codon:yes stop_codon:yes gene_type:complete
MELARILLKLLYLTVLYIITYFVVKPQVQLDGMNLNMVVLGFSVLIMYFTFDYVYEFLMTSELILKNTNESDEEEIDDVNSSEISQDTNVPKNGSQTTVENKVHVNNKKSSEYLMDHNHKFVQNKIFN